MIRPFYLFLMVLWGALAFYTARVVSTDGFGLFPIFFGAIADWTWPGQFNLDFLMMLVVSASWTAWRNAFTPAGIVLAVVALFGGAGFLLPYLTYLAAKHRGDTAAILLGAHHKDHAA